jgi:hypothetical protein
VTSILSPHLAQIDCLPALTAVHSSTVILSDRQSGTKTQENVVAPKIRRQAGLSFGPDTVFSRG